MANSAGPSINLPPPALTVQGSLELLARLSAQERHSVEGRLLQTTLIEQLEEEARTENEKTSRDVLIDLYPPIIDLPPPAPTTQGMLELLATLTPHARQCSEGRLLQEILLERLEEEARTERQNTNQHPAANRGNTHQQGGHHRARGILNEVRTIVTVIGLVSGYALVALLSIAVAATLITCAWNWFIVPVSTGREIGLGEGVGLYIVVGILIQFVNATRITFDDIKSDESTTSFWLILGRGAKVGISYPIVTLVIAWLWHTFFMPTPH